MHGVFGAAFWHVAVHAVGRRDLLGLMRGCMASAADSCVMLDRLLAAQHLVRIVTSRTSHLAGPKTGGFAQAVGGVSNLETIFLGVRSTIEINRVIAER